MWDTTVYRGHFYLCADSLRTIRYATSTDNTAASDRFPPHRHVTTRHHCDTFSDRADTSAQPRSQYDPVVDMAPELYISELLDVDHLDAPMSSERQMALSRRHAHLPDIQGLVHFRLAGNVSLFCRH